MEGESTSRSYPRKLPFHRIPSCRPKSIHEEISSAEAELIPPIQRPSPKPEIPEEGFQPLDFPFFEDELFDDFENSSNQCAKLRFILISTSLLVLILIF